MSTLLVTMAMIGYVIFYLTYPFKGLVVNESPVSVIQHEIKAGDQLEYELDYCRFSDRHAQTTRQFIDGVIYTTPTLETIADTGCHVKKYAVLVPETLNGGTYHLRVIVDVEINKLRSVQTVFITEDFRIIGLNEIHEKEDEAKFEKIGL